MDSENGDLREVWCTTARRATDAQLVACVAAAILSAVAFAVFLLADARRAFTCLPVVLPVLFVGAFGLWGIADRELEGGAVIDGVPRLSRGALVAVKWCSAVAAAIVGTLGAFGLLRLTIGTWIS